MVLLASLVSTFQLLLDIPKQHDFMHLGAGYTVGLFFGWLINATLSNIFILIQQRGIKGGRESQVLNVAFVALHILSHAAITLLLDVETLKMIWPVSFVLLWSVHWVLWRSEQVATGGETWKYLLGTSLASAIVLTTILRTYLEYDFLELSMDLDIII